MRIVFPNIRGKFYFLYQALLLTFTLASPSLCWSKEIAILISSNTSAYTNAEKSFRLGVGTRVDIKTYRLDGKTYEGRKMAQQIRASSPDLVLAIGLKAALVAKIEIVDTPVLFCMVLYPERNGLPTANMYGISMSVPISEQLSSIQQMVPSLKRIGLLYDSSRSDQFVNTAQVHAEAAGLSIIAKPIDDKKMVPKVLRALLPQVDLLWLNRDPKIVNVESTAFILETAIDHNVPIFAFSPGLVRHGALASLAPNFADIGNQASQIAKGLLKDKPITPSRPLIPPDTVRLALNIHTANVLGLTPSPATMQLAEVVYGGRPHIIVQQGMNPADDFLSDVEDTSVLVR